jgi:hypothetical protein
MIPTIANASWSKPKASASASASASATDNFFHHDVADYLPLLRLHCLFPGSRRAAI